MLNNLILFCFLFSCSWAQAQGPENIEKLSQDSYWLKLLHYDHSFFGKPKSEIETPEFFLSKKGINDPREELISTIESLTNSPDAYCRFPARRKWLERHGMNFPTRNCKDYDGWTRGNGVKSISLIFATGFLGNPASYFGHPLLKLNFKDQRSPLNLLDTAVNYGAFTPPGIDPVRYAIFGMFGGFKAGFSSVDYFFHKNNYSELELRDLWEYELELSDDQVDQIVSHLWEVRVARIDYYFFDDNCAYRMGEVLELITDQELISKNTPYAIPSALFHHLYENKLVRTVQVHGSRQTRLIEKFTSLNKNEQKEVTLIAADVDHIQSRSFKSLTENEKTRILETSSDYFSFRQVLDSGDESFKVAKKKILQERITLPPGKNEWTPLDLQPPHQSQKPQLLQFGYFYSDKFKSSGSLRFRPVYYDLISPDAGRAKLTSLNVMDLDLNFNKDRLWLKTFNLVSIESLNISKTGLPGDGGFAWKVKAGADQVNLGCNTCLVTRIEAGAGKAWEFSNFFSFFAMLDPRIQSSYQRSGLFALTPNVGSVITLSDDFRILATAGRRYYLTDDKKIQNMYSVEGRIGSSRSWDMRIGYQEFLDKRISAGFGYFW